MLIYKINQEKSWFIFLQYNVASITYSFDFFDWFNVLKLLYFLTITVFWGNSMIITLILH